MVSFIDITRNQYKRILSESKRRQARKFLLNVVRKINGLYPLNKLGVSICRGYYVVNATSINDLPYVAEKNIDYKITREVQNIREAKHLPLQVDEDLGDLTVEIESIILRITDPEFRLSNNHLIDPSLNVLGGYNTQFGTLPVSKQFLERPIHLPKTVAYLSDPEPTNYYHWMCGTLPLLRFYQEQFESIDLFYVGTFALRAFHLESLGRAGVNQNQLVQHASTADKLMAAISTRFVRLNDPISKEAYEFSRHLFSDVISQARRTDRDRLYVQRGTTGRRRVINESEVKALLQNYGFTFVQMDGKSVQEQAEIFASAEAVVAAHGAALTNLLFIQPGTKVIEIFPDGYINNCFFTLARYGRADYYYLLAESIEQMAYDSHSLDIKVDIDKLDELLKMAFLNP